MDKLADRFVAMLERANINPWKLASVMIMLGSAFIVVSMIAVAFMP